jgi:general secretion pathway protein A
MYDRFYGFREEPFRLSPDHHFAYQHRGYKKARAYMAYAFMRAEGFVMVTGRPGTGKTTLVGALIDDLASERALIANLVCSQLQADDLLSMVAHEFGVDINVTNKGQQIQLLSRSLQKWNREGRRALLIVDEAQDLSITAMEELRLLTNIQVSGKPLLQIFLLGQPELRELILRPEMEQVHQRIVAASHLLPLEPDETEQYVRHRLTAAGWRNDPAMSKAVYPLIFKFSEGIPRRINLICSRLMLHGSVEELHRIGAEDVRTVVEELQGESLAAGSVFTEADFDVEDEFEPELQAVSGNGSGNGPGDEGLLEADDEGRNAKWRRRMRRHNRS